MASNFPCAPMGAYPPERVFHYPVTAAQTFIAGALVYLTSGALSECGSDPSVIAGIALAPASVGLDSKGSIFGGTNIPIFPIISSDIIVMGSSTTPVQATHESVSYGIVKSTNWLVDTSDTSNKRVRVVKVRLSPYPEQWLVRFLGASLQFDGAALT